MPDKDSPQKDPILASFELKHPVNVYEVGQFLQNKPEAEIHVIEVKTGQMYKIEVNERGDICVRIGKSRVLLRGREALFSLAEESRTILDDGNAREQAATTNEIRGIRRYNALEINNILAIHLQKDMVAMNRRKRLEQARAQPRQQLVNLYRTIVSCQDAYQLRIRLRRIVKFGPTHASELHLIFKWFHEHEHHLTDMQKKLAAMGYKPDRQNFELSFEIAATDNDLEYACKNAGMERHLYTSK